MIQTSTQLKDKIKNLSGGNGSKAQLLLRNYMMERFLARISISKYKDNFILKGGMLVSAVVGVQARATMDIDTTVKALPLNLADTKRIIEEIASIDIQDGITFEIKKTSEIMEEHDYPGIRIVMDAYLQKLKQAIKIDVSTGDEITPEAIRYSYKLMFDQGEISIWTYNLETLMAEKLETVIARGVANTRMRDFYDIHTIWAEKEKGINVDTLKEAFQNTAKKRNTIHLIESSLSIIEDVERSSDLKKSWINFRLESVYVGDLDWAVVVLTVKTVLALILG